MKPAGLIDLHCDTLTSAQPGSPAFSHTLNDPARQIALSKITPGTKWAQFFAIFIPDDRRGQEAIDYFDAYQQSFEAQMAQNAGLITPCRSFTDIHNAFAAGKFAGILTVEGGCVLAGDLRRVETIADAGVRALTLVWNGENEIGSGHNTTKGLTSFGKEAVTELERRGILIDVSHLNDAGFEDLLAIAQRPFIATHSNARAVASHKRNLPDAFIQEIIRREGLIGLNYHMPFLRDGESQESFDDLYRHTMHFLELGAEDCLALGSDYDGSDIAPCLNSVEKSFGIFDYFLSHGISQMVADKIFFYNAYRFFEKNW